MAGGGLYQDDFDDRPGLVDLSSPLDIVDAELLSEQVVHLQ
jgi:hypothetical protein